MKLVRIKSPEWSGSFPALRIGMNGKSSFEATLVANRNPLVSGATMAFAEGCFSRMYSTIASTHGLYNSGCLVRTNMFLVIAKRNMWACNNVFILCILNLLLVPWHKRTRISLTRGKKIQTKMITFGEGVDFRIQFQSGVRILSLGDLESGSAISKI